MRWGPWKALRETGLLAQGRRRGCCLGFSCRSQQRIELARVSLRTQRQRGSREVARDRGTTSMGTIF